MLQPRAYDLILETGDVTRGVGQQDVPIRRYRVVGRTTEDTFTNKTIISPTNTIAANNLLVGNTVTPIAPGGAIGDVLTLTATGSQFQTPTGGGETYETVRMVANGLTRIGTTYYVTLDAPFDTLGTSANTITQQAATTAPAGTEFFSSKVIFSVRASICVQSTSQAAARFASLVIISDGVEGIGCNQTIPANINAFRSSLQAMEYGKAIGVKLVVEITSNVVSIITFQSGYVDIVVIV